MVEMFSGKGHSDSNGMASANLGRVHMSHILTQSSVIAALAAAISPCAARTILPCAARYPRQARV